MTSPIAIYAGTFDPVTNGHLNIIQRAVKLFPHLVIAVADNPGKNPMFSVQERRFMLRAVTLDIPGLDVVSFSGLLVDAARAAGATVMIRGLRPNGDFDYECQIAAVNKSLDPGIETIFMMAEQQHQAVASSLVKDVAKHGGNIEQFVPEYVADCVKNKLKATVVS